MGNWPHTRKHFDDWDIKKKLKKTHQTAFLNHTSARKGALITTQNSTKDPARPDTLRDPPQSLTSFIQRCWWGFQVYWPLYKHRLGEILSGSTANDYSLLHLTITGPEKSNPTLRPKILVFLATLQTQGRRSNTFSSYYRLQTVAIFQTGFKNVYLGFLSTVLDSLYT